MDYSIHDRSHFNSLVEKLRGRLKHFSVINLQGDRIGIIKDLIVDSQRQLQIIISTTASNLTPSLQLQSKQIKKIEIVDKIVVVDFPLASNNETANLSPVMQSEPLATKAMTHPAQDQTESQLTSEQNLPEEIVKLLAERVIVERKKRKIGEVIVRKEIATRMVEVPVRYEKLIVEQVNPERKQIAEINLGQETLAELESRTSVNTVRISSELPWMTI
jgi:stress response protein YsnF